MRQTIAKLESELQKTHEEIEKYKIYQQSLQLKIQNLEDLVKNNELEHKTEIEKMENRIKKRDQFVQRVLLRLETIRSLIQVPPDTHSAQNDYMPDMDFLKNNWDGI